MNKKVIKRFSIMQTGKLLAVLYGFLSLAMIPFLALSFLFSMGEGKGAGVGMMFFMIILYPVMGFIGGIIGAALYNLSSKWVGGLEITLDDVVDVKSVKR